MANNYQQFSVSINDLTDEEHAWLDKLLQAMADAPEILLDSENVGEGGEELIADWKKFTEQLGVELSDIVKAIAYDDSGDKGYWGQTSLSKTGEASYKPSLWLYEEESCNLESPVELIHQFFKRHQFFKKFRPTEYLVLSWAETCSKMRVDEFGGGECLITGDWVYWPPRHLHNMAVIYADAKQAGKTMTAEEALAIIEERMEP
jgi:hypothetical protein